MKPHKTRANSINYFLFIFIVVIFFASCTKKVDEAPFKQVNVIQAGELIVVQGFTQGTESWEYLVRVMVCGEPVEILVIVKKGETYGETKFQSNCKFESFTILKSRILTV